MVPNIIHFTYGFCNDFGGRQFSFIHYLSILTAKNVNQPDKIYFHYCYEPKGTWWNLARPYITLVKYNPKQEIFGNKLTHYAHKADVARLEILLQHGGIYLDLDVICINSLKPLLKYECVLGREENVGLCNAVIIAEKKSKFLQIWYTSYKNFDENNWNYHSVILPGKLSKKYRNLIHIENEYSFFYPINDDPVAKYLWSEDRYLKINKVTSILRKLKRKIFANDRKGNPLTIIHSIFNESWHFNKLQNSFVIHLWETNWWEKYLSEITINSVISREDNFSKLIRSIIPMDHLKQLVAEYQNRRKTND